MDASKLQSYRDAAAAAVGAAATWPEFATRLRVHCLADAVVELAAEVERLQNELRVAEQTIADFYETGDSP